jgi:hypothetical protein
VRYDPNQQAYRFEFRDEDNPSEVPSNLADDPGPVVEQLIDDLDSLAAGRSGYSATRHGITSSTLARGCGSNWFPGSCGSSSGIASTGYGI